MGPRLLPQVHAPATQISRAPHRMPQPPQWLTLVDVAVSQPFVSFPSQFAYPTSHIPMRQAGGMSNAVIAHVAVACTRVQVVPQLPQ